MEDVTYHIKIKKEYATAILEDLQQIDAIEIVEEPVTEWQQKESLKRLAEMKANPDSVVAEESFFNELEKDDDEV